MLSKINRLPRPDVKIVMRSGRRRTFPHLTLMYKKNPLGGPPRFACIVSPTIDKRATVRNRTKRLLRESLRRLLPKIPRGIDGAIIVRKKLTSLRETKESIKGLLTP